MLSPLTGVVVLEVDADLPIQFAGRALTDLGATVIKVEPMGGDPLRREPPLSQGGASSTAFDSLNSRKQCEVVDLGTTAGRARLEELAASSHVAVLSAGSTTGRAGITVRPRKVVAELEAVVRRSDGSPGRVEPLTRFHASGSGSLFPVWDPQVRPASAGRFIFDAMYGVAFASAITTALVVHRSRPPESGPTPVRFSTKAYGPWLEKMFIHRVALEGVDLRRTNHMYPYGGNIRCRDGHICIYIAEEHQWHNFVDMIGAPDWHTDPRFADGIARARNAAEIRSAMEGWCAARTVDEVMESTRAADVPAGRVASPGWVLGKPGMRARGFVAEAPGGGVEIRTPFGSEWNTAVRVGVEP